MATMTYWLEEECLHGEAQGRLEKLLLERWNFPGAETHSRG